MSTDTTTTTIDSERAAAFSERLLQAVDAASLVIQCSIGDQLGLFDALSQHPWTTSVKLAESMGLQERYVREWLAALTVAGVVNRDRASDTYHLPAEHASSLTHASGSSNLARLCRYIPMLAEPELRVVEAFKNGGGVPYSAFTRFHDVMAEDSAAINDASLLDAVVPILPGQPDGLAAGIDVADFGCGSGHAINLLGRAYPRSRFVGYDFSDEAIRRARAEAGDWGLNNVRFEVQDVAAIDLTDAFDLITAFDTIHDQAQPAEVLAAIARALRPEGAFLMVDSKGHSNVSDNLELPLATFLYTCSVMHCMAVSLELDGVGLGTVWGQETALRMLGDAGFADVQIRELATNLASDYFVCTLS